MEIKEVLLKRRSVRRFTDEPVSEEMTEELLHAAMSGPSACNATPWSFYVVTEEKTLSRLRMAARYTNIHAPLAIAVCGDLSRALPGNLSSFWVQDCSAATENILLAATGLNLGAVWCGINPQEEAEKTVSEILGLSGSEMPLNIIYIGHPAEFPEARDQYNGAYIHYIK